ncbi:MAG: TonB-dependent receptor [Bacteroidales bacterium]|jgi:iron complex outermembrane receptor protein|nr:TonB-dependent receptor [Bacteroidales bacterium]
MTKKLFLLTVCLFSLLNVVISQDRAQESGVFSGKVTGPDDEALIGATVYVEEVGVGDDTDLSGHFTVENIPEGRHTVIVSYVGYEKVEQELDFKNYDLVQDFYLQPDEHVLLEVEVFGVRKERPEKMDALTRIPLRLDEQVQSISVISQKMLNDQGVLTLNDAVRNVPGVTTFGTFGNTTESLTSRGYRGIPVVKNGVRVHSDFRGNGFLADMQGVETIQILRGSAAIAQGLGNDLGSAGGVVNIATKTPKFINSGNIGIRTGSWGQVRPTFDLQFVTGRLQRTAFRINGAYEQGDSYRSHVSKDRIYINPSFAWHPDDKTKVSLEMDFMHDSRTPDQGTVNLSADSIYNVYDMPYDRFMGFKTDRQIVNTLTYMGQLNRELSNRLSVRVAYAGADMSQRKIGAHVSPLRNAAQTGLYNLRSRVYSGSNREDKNGVLQIDLIGKDIYTGVVRHTFNVGLDYRWTDVSTISTNSVVTDTINVLQSINNETPLVALVDGEPVTAREYAYGMLLQEVMTFNRYLKLSLGLRYSQISGVTDNNISTTGGSVWDPLMGLIITPIKNINLFASFTTTTSLRGAANLLEDKVTHVGPSREKQFEAGFKTEWLNNRLRFNATWFNIMNNNLTYAALNDAGSNTGYYIKAGNLKRQGLELELTGKLIKNMDVVMGYSYLDAGYKDSPYYHEGSAPMNTANHIANGWFNYTFFEGALRNLTLGAGAYYVGERPFAEYTYKVLPGHHVEPNIEPFIADAYTTLNVKVGYRYRNILLQMFVNNILDAKGYTAYYRGGYLNPTDPRNIAVSLNYQF